MFDAPTLEGKLMNLLLLRNAAVALAAALITAFGLQPYEFASRLAGLLP
jgi:hypothetical protein